MKKPVIIALISLLIAGCAAKMPPPDYENMPELMPPPSDDSLDGTKIIPVKHSGSTEGCVEEGYHLITPSIQSEWETRRSLKCCEGLTAISEADYPALFDINCVPAPGSGLLCSNCGDGFCEDWESRCSCMEDCADE